jgi:hypothetical protein
MVDEFKPIIIEDIEFQDQGEFPYPNPMSCVDLSILSTQPIKALFDYVQDKIINSPTFSKMNIKLRKGEVSSIGIRKWEDSQDVRFESFNLIEGSHEFVFCEIHANVGKEYKPELFKPKVFKIHCFRLQKTESYPSMTEEDALAKVDNEKWADWKVDEVLETFYVFSYSLNNPEQYSMTMKISKNDSEENKSVLIAFTYEECNFQVFPAALYELN